MPKGAGSSDWQRRIDRVNQENLNKRGYGPANQNTVRAARRARIEAVQVDRNVKTRRASRSQGNVTLGDM